MSANCRYPPLVRFFFRPLSRMVCGLSFVCCAMRQHRIYVNCPAWYAGCRSSAALCVSIASMSIARHNMPVVLFGGIFASVPLLGVVMRYTIPPLFFVNYVGILSRHRLCRSTNSYVPRCLVRAISVSAFPFFRQLSRMVCGLSFVCCAMRQHRVYVNCPA